MTAKDLLIILQLLFDNKSKTLTWDDIFSILGGELPDKVVKESLGFIIDKNLIKTRYILNDRGIEYFNNLKLSIDQNDKDNKAARTKLHNESWVSSWAKWTYWPLFILGIITFIRTFNSDNLSKSTQSEMYQLKAKVDTLSLRQDAAKNMNDSLTNTMTSQKKIHDTTSARHDK